MEPARQQGGVVRVGDEERRRDLLLLLLLLLLPLSKKVLDEERRGGCGGCGGGGCGRVQWLRVREARDRGRPEQTLVQRRRSKHVRKHLLCGFVLTKCCGVPTPEFLLCGFSLLGPRAPNCSTLFVLTNLSLCPRFFQAKRRGQRLRKESLLLITA